MSKNRSPKVTPVMNVVVDETITPTAETSVETTTETVTEVIVTPEAVTVSESKVPGRPVMADSKRQQRLLELEIKRQSGGVKKGRPVSGESKRQIREAELKAKREAGELKPGRPKYTPEEKAAADAEKAERRKAEQERISALAKRMVDAGITDATMIAEAIKNNSVEELIASHTAAPTTDVVTEGQEG